VWGAGTGTCITSTSGLVIRAQFLAYADGFEGGVYVGAGNVDASTAADEIITGPGSGGGPNVRIWRANANGTATQLASYMAFSSGSTGVRVGASDMTCGADDEVVATNGPGATTEVRVHDFNTAFLGSFYPYGAYQSGAFVGGGNFSTSNCGGETATGPDAGGGPKRTASRRPASTPTTRRSSAVST